MVPSWDDWVSDERGGAECAAVAVVAAAAEAACAAEAAAACEARAWLGQVSRVVFVKVWWVEREVLFEPGVFERLYDRHAGLWVGLEEGEDEAERFLDELCKQKVVSRDVTPKRFTFS